MNTKKLGQLKSQIPGDLVKRIDHLEEDFNNRPKDKAGNKIATFDLDNTLLEEDVGEAVFFQLQIDEKKAPLTIDQKRIPFTWGDYQALLEEDKKMEAYTRAVTAMAGIPIETITDTTRRVMESNDRFLELAGSRVPLPSPNPVMQALVDYLKSLAYEIYIISASNHFSVRYVARVYFGIQEPLVFGMKSRVTDIKHPISGKKVTVLKDQLIEPVTVGEGKAGTYKMFIGSVQPLITAGDSTTDIQVFNLSDRDGLIIWVGKDDKKLAWVKEQVTHPENVYFLKRG